MKFDMGETWQRAIAMVGANFQLMAIVAGVFLLLPSMAVYLLIPDFASMLDPTADPETMAAQMEGMIGPIAAMGFISLILQFVGYSALVALMGQLRPTVGQAIQLGIKSILTLIGTAIIFTFGYSLALMAIFFLFGLLSAAAGTGIFAFIAFIIATGMTAFIMARLSITLAIIVLEEQRNPITAMLRSWQLTGPHQWRIMGFWILLVVAYLVIGLLAFGLFGVVAAAAGGTLVSALVLGIFNGLIGALVAMLISGIIVAIYQQLAGDTPEAISQTFE